MQNRPRSNLECGPSSQQRTMVKFLFSRGMRYSRPAGLLDGYIGNAWEPALPFIFVGFVNLIDHNVG